MAKTTGLDPQNKVKVCFDYKMFDVADWVPSINRRNGPGGSPSHETFSVAPQRGLEFPQSLNNLLPWLETISPHLDWWQNPLNVLKGSDLHPKDHSIKTFTDTPNIGWGTHSDQDSVKGEKRLHINVLDGPS